MVIYKSQTFTSAVLKHTVSSSGSKSTGSDRSSPVLAHTLTCMPCDSVPKPPLRRAAGARLSSRLQAMHTDGVGGASRAGPGAVRLSQPPVFQPASTERRPRGPSCRFASGTDTGRRDSRHAPSQSCTGTAASTTGTMGRGGGAARLPSQSLTRRAGTATSRATTVTLSTAVRTAARVDTTTTTAGTWSSPTSAVSRTGVITSASIRRSTATAAITPTTTDTSTPSPGSGA